MGPKFNDHYTSSDRDDDGQAKIDDLIQAYADYRGITFEEAKERYADTR